MNTKEVKAGTIGEFFGTLQQCVVETWRKHLITNKHSKHVILDDFYTDAPDLVDAIIEGWMGSTGEKVENYKNNFTAEKIDALEYLKLLKDFTKLGVEDFIDSKDTEVLSLVDDFLNLINSTIYKLNQLSESKMMSLRDYIRS